MKKQLSKTAVLVSALGGAGYGIYYHNFWIGILGFFVAGAIACSLEYLISCKCKDNCDK